MKSWINFFFHFHKIADSVKGFYKQLSAKKRIKYDLTITLGNMSKYYYFDKMIKRKLVEAPFLYFHNQNGSQVKKN